MTDLPSKDQIKGFECKHAIYTPANDGSNDDVVIVKEVVHTKDGRLIPRLRFFENYKRDFYITREGFRKHQEKKEWEHLNRLQKFSCRQTELVPSIVRAIGYGNPNGSLRRVARSPYLYGADISTPTLIKQYMYRDRWPDAVSNNRVAVFDIETDVVEGTGDPIYLSLTFKDKAFLVITEQFAGTMVKPEEQLLKAFDKYLGEIKKERNVNLEVMVAKTPGQGIKAIFAKAHEWMPDFVTIWNINFDIPKCIKVLLNEGIDPADVFSDPSVPDKYKFFKYKEGPATKKTASGRVDSIHPAERWHVAECPASFFLIDSMCVYKRIRLAKQNEPSYSLDAILKKHLKLGKLKFAEADKYTGLAWHQFMQSNYKVEYGIYNVFDCIGVEMLDEKTKDLCQIISTQSRASEYTIYNSQPKRLVDDIFFFVRQYNVMPSSCSDDMVPEIDKYVTDMKGWIVTLPSHLTVENGLFMLKELPDVRSHIRTHVADLDIVSTYPNVQTILNISKETTYREMAAIKGVPKLTQRMAGINLTGGFVNAVEIVCDLYGAPNFEEMLSAFEEDLKQTETSVSVDRAA